MSQWNTEKREGGEGFLSNQLLWKLVSKWADKNWTRTSADLLGAVYLYTDYRVPVQEMREELNRILRIEMSEAQKHGYRQILK